jgi:hypothetical protein
MKTIGRIRRGRFVHGNSIQEITGGLRLSRYTFTRPRALTRSRFLMSVRCGRPKPGRWQDQLSRLLAVNVEERLTLRALGYEGG